MATRAEQLAAVFLERRAAIGAGSDKVFEIERWKGGAAFGLAVGAMFFAATHVESLPVSDGSCRAPLFR